MNRETGFPLRESPFEMERRLVVRDLLPADCKRCKALGYHVPMCVPCALVRAGLPETHPTDRLFRDETDEST